MNEASAQIIKRAAGPWSQVVVELLDKPLTCLLAGLMMPLCYAPFRLSWLIFLLLLPLLVACRHPNPDTRVRRGLLFGVGYFCFGSYWFAQTLVQHLEFAWLTALLGHVLITGACALAPTGFCWLAGYFCQTKEPQFYRTNDFRSRSTSMALLWSLCLVGLWVAIEDIRFQAFGGGPWLSLSLSQVDSPLRGYLPVLGEIGTSGVVLLISQWLLVGLSGQFRGLLQAAVLIVLLLLGGSYLTTHEWTEPTGNPTAIALVQTAVAQSAKQDLSKQSARLEDLSRLSQPYLGKAKLIVWPETVVTLNRGDIDQALADLGERAKFARSTLLVGAYESSLKQSRFNTAFTLGYEGGQKYQKRHLVPFGEYVPDFLAFMDDYVPGDAHRSLGRGALLIANSGVLFGVSICWEGSFSRDNNPLVRAGAHVLINIANEAWFAGSSLPAQNLDAVRVRAIETGRPAVRVANFGPGAIIDHQGRIVTELEADQPDSDLGSVQPRFGATPFVLLGADFVFVSAVAMILITGFFIRRKYKLKRD